MKYFLFLTILSAFSFAAAAQGPEPLVAGADAPFENLGQPPVTVALKQPAATPAIGHSRLPSTKTSGHRPGTKVQTRARQAAEPTVYYCASGNTVKYHATSNCRGLNRCGATVTPITLREAQQSMQPCKWCY